MEKDRGCRATQELKAGESKRPPARRAGRGEWAQRGKLSGRMGYWERGERQCPPDCSLFPLRIL